MQLETNILAHFIQLICSNILQSDDIVHYTYTHSVPDSNT